MTQKEIIEFEENNTDVIRLYLEGSFYKAYERSAFALCTRVKDYRVLRKEHHVPCSPHTPRFREVSGVQDCV